MLIYRNKQLFVLFGKPYGHKPCGLLFTLIFITFAAETIKHAA